MWRPRPLRLELRASGEIWAMLFLAASVGLAAARGLPPWALIALGAAAGTTAAVWRISGLVNQRRVWFGVAVFLSVPLFGTAMTMARNLTEPRVQPVAIIRSSDASNEALQGLYVTESSDRVYFATVETEGCSDDLRPDSTRLLWVPKEEVVAMSVGRAQTVESAGTTALEMAYGLTPAVETPAAGPFTLTPEERRYRESAAVAAPAADGNRLESSERAVRPYFGSGMTLSEEIVTAGEEVSLTLNDPSEYVDEDGETIRGFGKRPEGRSVRLNGIRLPLVREETDRAAEVEYVQATVEDDQGEEEVDVPLDDAGVFARVKSTPTGEEELERVPRDQLEDGGDPGLEYFVKVAPYAVVGDEPVPIAVRVEGGRISLIPGATVDLPDAGTVTLQNSFRKQAWSEEEIRFRVPEVAHSGVIAIDCEQLAGQPLLRVARAPDAQVSVRMRPGSNEVVFDSSASRDTDPEPVSATSPASGDAQDVAVAGGDGDDLVRAWWVEGRQVRAGESMTAVLPPRLAPYEVELRVRDRDGATDRALIQMLRVPVAEFNFNEARPRSRKRLEEIRDAFVEAVGERTPLALEFHGHADDVGDVPYNFELSLRRATRVRFLLLKMLRAEASMNSERDASAPGRAEPDAVAGPPVAIATRGFGETCPIDRRGGRRPANRRVEVFIVGEGVEIEPPPGCRAHEMPPGTWQPRQLVGD